VKDYSWPFKDLSNKDNMEEWVKDMDELIKLTQAIIMLKAEEQNKETNNRN
jgi:hypothetical protein